MTKAACAALESLRNKKSIEIMEVSMKRWLTLFLFTTLLAACSTPAAVTDIPLPPTVTLQPTETLIPTPQATATPTETPTPDIASTEAGATAIKLFEQIKVDPSTYDLKMDGNVIVGIDKATGKEIFRDGKFELHYAVQAAVNSGELVPTKYKPRPMSSVGVPNIPPEVMTAEYFIPLFKRAMVEFKNSTGLDLYIKGKTGGTSFMLDPDKLAYGIVSSVDRKDPNSPTYLIYEKNNGEIVIVPVGYVSLFEAADFWSK